MLGDISTLLPVLDDALVPGASAPGASHVPPGEDQVDAFRAERAERHLLKTKYLPESAAPANLDIVMAIADVKTMLTSAYSQAMQLAELPQRCRRCNHLMSEHGGSRGARCGLCEPCPGFGLTFVPPGDRMWGALLGNDEAVATTIEPMLSSALHMAESALSDHQQSWLLMEPCPWCEGKTKSMPEGSLTIRVFVPGTAAETYAVCQNINCTVGEDDCGARRRGRPMWRYHELDWLSDKVDEAARKRKLAAAIERAIGSAA